MKRILNEGQLRRLVSDLVKEYVANTDGDPHKDDHADPTGVEWGSGLIEGDKTEHDSAALDFLRSYYMGNIDVDELAYLPKSDPRAQAFDKARKAGYIHLDDRYDTYVISDKGMAALEENPGEDPEVADAIRYGVEGDWPRGGSRGEL